MQRQAENSQEREGSKETRLATAKVSTEEVLCVTITRGVCISHSGLSLLWLSIAYLLCQM